MMISSQNNKGVKTPDAFWKVIIRNDRAIAWIIPNNADAKRDRLDEYCFCESLFWASESKQAAKMTWQ